MGQINTNNYPIVDSLLDDDLLIVENATNGTGTTTPKQLRENAIGTDPLQTTAQTVTGAINELKNSGALPETPLSIAHGGTGNTAGYIRTGALSGSTIGTKATAEGYNTTASGNYSHASGYYTQAKYDSQTAIGKYNNNMSDTLFEVGNGTGSSAKSNALEVYSDGRVHTNKLIVGNDNQVGANTVTGIAMGAGVTAGYENQVAVGVANNNRSDTLFEVGNGSLRGQHKNAFEVYSNGNIKAQGTVSDVNGTLNAVTANPSDTASTDLTKIKIGNTAYNIPSGSGGSGNTKVKTLYELYASSWSSAPNSDGFYTAQVTLNPTLDPGFTPDILLAGSSASAQPTDTYRTMFSYVERGYMSGSTLTLYAKTKPTSLFKFWVEGVSGSGTLAVACNVIQPNGAVSGGEASIDISSLLNTSASQVGTVTISAARRVGKMCHVWGFISTPSSASDYSGKTIFTIPSSIAPIIAGRMEGFSSDNTEHTILYVDGVDRVRFTGDTTNQNVAKSIYFYVCWVIA